MTRWSQVRMLAGPREVDLGDDADTTGAIYGQLAGAYWGASAIPAEWRTRLALGDRIEALAGRLLELAARLGPNPLSARC